MLWSCMLFVFSKISFWGVRNAKKKEKLKNTCNYHQICYVAVHNDSVTKFSTKMTAVPVMPLQPPGGAKTTV